LEAGRPRACARGVDEFRSFLHPIEPHQRATQVTLRRAILRIRLNRAYEESAGEIVLPAGKKNQTHLAKCDGVSWLEPERSIELCASGSEISFFTRDSGKEHMRRSGLGIFLHRFGELTARSFALSVLHRVDSGSQSLAARSAPAEGEPDADYEQNEHCRTNQHGQRQFGEATSRFGGGERLLDSAASDPAAAEL
jgi:hypothetical protein